MTSKTNPTPQASAEKSQRSLTATLNELTKKIEEVNLNLGDFEAGKRRITVENADLLRQLQELNANASLMTKTKSALVSALDEQKAIADNEAKERVSLLGKFRFCLFLQTTQKFQSDIAEPGTWSTWLTA